MFDGFKSGFDTETSYLGINVSVPFWQCAALTAGGEFRFCMSHTPGFQDILTGFIGSVPYPGREEFSRDADVRNPQPKLESRKVPAGLHS